MLCFFFYSIQVEQDDNTTSQEQLETTLDQEALGEDISVHSTKRLRIMRGAVKETQRKEKEEEALLRRAISCMEAVSSCAKDADAVFGDYIASELSTITNQETKRWLKHQMQSLIYSATT